MPRKKKPSVLEQYLMPKKGVFSQEFLILVVTMVIGIIVAGQILSAGGPPQHDDHGTKKFQAKKADKPTGLPKNVPVNVWNGTATPIEIPPGLPPVIERVPTTQPIVFVTIDDGWEQTPENINWLMARRLPFSIFLTNEGIKSNYQYYYSLQSAGMTVQNHTLSHHSLPKMTPEEQKAEICGASDIYQDVFKHRPTLFRPPYGEYSDVTRQIVGECGMKAVVMWKATIENGAVQYQDPSARLVPGDIILAHFEPGLTASLEALSQQLAAQGLQVARLEDWIK